MPMDDGLRQVAERVTRFVATGGEAPYMVYVYPPADEFTVRRELGELRLWLQAQDVRCVSVSLAALFWQALEESGFLESLIAAERDAGGNPDRLNDVYRSVGEILREPPNLPERVVTALSDYDARTAAFLYRAGALYPAYRTSALLDDLRHQVNLPVTLLYPGRLEGTFGLSFMGRCEPAYGYRATIIPRGGAA